MVLGNNDYGHTLLTNSNTRVKQKKSLSTGHQQKRQWSPFHLLLLLYGVIAVIGILFNWCN